MDYQLTEEDKKAMNIAKDILGTGRYINYMTGKGAGDVSKVLDGTIIEQLELIKENQQKAREEAVKKYDKQRLEEEVKRRKEKRNREILEKRKILSEAQKSYNEEIEQNKARKDEQQNTLNRLLMNRLNNAKGGSIPQQMELFLSSGADVSKETKEKRTIQYTNAESKKTKKELDDIAKNIKSEQSTEDSFKDSMKKLEGQKKEISEFSKMKKKDFANMTIDELIELKKRMQDLGVRSNFSEGGLKDEGNTVDPVSGNDVPPGATQEEVRDDIPAQLSEGEFVFPADVVRYIGLEKLMMIRQRAKAGLQRMEEMGQMGNSEEAILPDDIPFDIEDLDMEDDPIEMQVGGVVTTNPNTGNPTNMMGGVTSTVTGNPVNTGMYNPNVNQMYTPGGVTPYAPATFQSLLPQSSTGQVQTEMIRFVNKETGQVRMIPFNKATGTSLYPIDNLLQQGFVREKEKPKEVAKTAKIATTKVKPVEQDSGNQLDNKPGGAVDLLGDPLSYKSIFNMDKLDTALKDIAFTQGMNIFNVKQQVLEKGIFGDADIANATLINQRDELNKFKNKISISGVYGSNFNLGEMEQKDRDILAGKLTERKEIVDLALRDDKGKVISMDKFKEELKKYGIKDFNRTGITKQDRENFANKANELGKAKIKEKEDIAEGMRKAGRRREQFPTRTASAKINELREAERQKARQAREEGSGDDSPPSYDTGTQASAFDTGSSFAKSVSDIGGIFTAKGGFIKKPKPKVKKMKRGGLASR